MKRLSIFITLLALTFIQMSAQDTSVKGTISLLHQGKTTDFAYNKMADVMDAAVDGDTVFLSTGYFEGDFVIDKKLAFIGEGVDRNNSIFTYYSGKIIIKLPENTKLTARLFEGIYLGNSTLNFQTAIEDVVFKKCYMYGNINIEADIESILFDRCNIISMENYCNSYTKKMIVRNCQITGLHIWSNYSNDENHWIFINCTIDPSNYGYTDDDGNYHNWCPIYRGTFVNCIIDNDDDYDSSKNSGFWFYDPQNTVTKSTASFTNCLFFKPMEGREIFNGATVENDMYFDALELNDNFENHIRNFTKEKLLKNNFLGNDGTVVGCYGGKNPYSLKISQPTISSSKVHFDKDNKQIQIKMKVVSSEQ